jgi:hypothetical protein
VDSTLVRFNNFGQLNPNSVGLTRELLDNPEAQDSPFMSFMFAWLSFNGWMESVTEEPRDALMITALADNRRMTDAYTELMHSNPQFQRRVMRFSDLWPVLNVRDVVKKLGANVFWEMEFDALMLECTRHDVKIAPPGWQDGDVPTWPQLLRTIYAVRCNLFHGAKSPQNDRDRRLVSKSDRILRLFIAESDCFNWID